MPWKFLELKYCPPAIKSPKCYRNSMIPIFDLEQYLISPLHNRGSRGKFHFTKYDDSDFGFFLPFLFKQLFLYLFYLWINWSHLVLYQYLYLLEGNQHFADAQSLNIQMMIWIDDTKSTKIGVHKETTYLIPLWWVSKGGRHQLNSFRFQRRTRFLYIKIRMNRLTNFKVKVTTI